MLRIICDRCGKEIQKGERVCSLSNSQTVAPNIPNIDAVSDFFDNLFEGLHFCPECMDEIAKFVLKTSGKDVSEPEILVKKTEDQEDMQKIPEAGDAPEGEDPIEKNESPAGENESPVRKNENPAVEKEPEKKKSGSKKPEGEKPKKKKATEKKRLDYGKIMALRHAGWTYAQIADEMGMTQNAVGVAINYYKKHKARVAQCEEGGQ